MNNNDYTDKKNAALTSSELYLMKKLEEAIAENAKLKIRIDNTSHFLRNTEYSNDGSMIEGALFNLGFDVWGDEK